MAMRNPRGRANYEPNSWPGEPAVRAKTRRAASRRYPEEEAGTKRRLRPESFADHYSQARQFYISQTEVERRHIADAFVFELSKCERKDIRLRMVAGLRNVHEDLAQAVADGLGLDELPDPLPPAREPRTDLPSPRRRCRSSPTARTASPAASSACCVTDGADAGLLGELRAAAERRGRRPSSSSRPTVGGVTLSDGSPRRRRPEARRRARRCSTTPSRSSPTTAAPPQLADLPPARDFVSDAFAHCKFIGHTEAATALFEAVGLGDEGRRRVHRAQRQRQRLRTAFLGACAQLRIWDRELAFV